MCNLGPSDALVTAVSFQSQKVEQSVRETKSVWFVRVDINLPGCFHFSTGAFCFVSQARATPASPLWWKPPSSTKEMETHSNSHLCTHVHTHVHTRTLTLSGGVLIILNDSRQAKISYFTEQALRHQDVSRPQVSVNVIPLLYECHALCDLQQNKKTVQCEVLERKQERKKKSA